MLKKEEYTKIIKKFYLDNWLVIKSIASKIKKIYYSIPLDVEDLIITSFEYFQNQKTIDEFEKLSFKMPLEKFCFSRIKFFMFSAAREFTNKNQEIMNNYITCDEIKIDFDLCDENHYCYEELFSFLSEKEFNLIYKLKVEKIKKSDLAKELNITLKQLKKLEQKIIFKIKKFYE